MKSTLLTLLLLCGCAKEKQAKQYYWEESDFQILTDGKDLKLIAPDGSDKLHTPNDAISYDALKHISAGMAVDHNSRLPRQQVERAWYPYTPPQIVTNTVTVEKCGCYSTASTNVQTVISGTTWNAGTNWVGYTFDTLIDTNFYDYRAIHGK